MDDFSPEPSHFQDDSFDHPPWWFSDDSFEYDSEELDFEYDEDDCKPPRKALSTPTWADMVEEEEALNPTFFIVELPKRSLKQRDLGPKKPSLAHGKRPTLSTFSTFSARDGNGWVERSSPKKSDPFFERIPLCPILVNGTRASHPGGQSPPHSAMSNTKSSPKKGKPGLIVSTKKAKGVGRVPIPRGCMTSEEAWTIQHKLDIACLAKTLLSPKSVQLQLSGFTPIEILKEDKRYTPKEVFAQREILPIPNTYKDVILFVKQDPNDHRWIEFTA